MKSPIPHKGSALLYTFTEAIQKVIEGHRITKLEWNSNDIYGVLHGGFLMLHKEDGVLYQWILSEGDMKGEDWAVLPEAT